MKWLSLNTWAAYAIGAVLLIGGAYTALKIHDAGIRKDAQAAQDAAIAVSVAQGQQREAKKWIAAYNASEEAKSNVNKSLLGYKDTNDELLRRIERMRHNQIHAAAVPGPDRDPKGADFDSEGAGLLSTALADLAAQCSLDYATVAVKLQAIDQLTLKHALSSK